MPKYHAPKKAVGLNLRAIIEGTVMNFVDTYVEAKAIADTIERRIQEGPSDWLSLSDGTTFKKSWVPEKLDEEPVSDRVGKFGNGLHENLVQHALLLPEDEHEAFTGQEDKLGILGHDSARSLVKSLDAINEAHQERVKQNSGGGE